MTPQFLSRVLFGIILTISTSLAFAGPLRSPVNLNAPDGYWTTIDDKTNKARSIIRIWENNGVRYGSIEKIFKQPGDKGVCTRCPGAFKNKPILGLTIIWGLKKTGDRVWSGGQILDPVNGKVYRVMLTLAPDGRSLKARGYVGFSVFGRTQYWYRHF